MKSWTQSKTIWVNVVTTVVAVATALAGQEWVMQNPALTALIGSVLGVTNILLRLVTSTKVE